MSDDTMKWPTPQWPVAEGLPFLVPSPSPNHNARRHPPKVVVLHADASPKESATLGWVRKPEAQVSYHVLVGRDGTAYRIVGDDRRAWANGKGRVTVNGLPRTDVNGVALNLAFANLNNGSEPLTTRQIATARGIVAWWFRKFHIEEPVTTHAAVALPEGRKTDPLRIPNFDLADYQPRT